MYSLAYPAFAILCVMLGLFVLWLSSALGSPRTGKVILLVAVAIPAVMYATANVRARLAELDLEKDSRYVRDLCEKNSYERINRRVEGVEGVLQVRGRDLNESQLRDQDGMFDPWGYATHDRSQPPFPVGYGADQYRFVETQVRPGASGPPFKRKILVRSRNAYGLRSEATDRMTDQNSWATSWITVNARRSKYGYISEDLTTPEMRKRWVGAGRTKIVDLDTGEVLAERTGYFRALGPFAPDHWAAGPAIQASRMCPRTSLEEFLRATLIPLPAVQPTPEYLQSLTH